MSELIANMEELLTNAVLILTMLMEVFGVCVLVYTAVKCFVKWLRKADNSRMNRRRWKEPFQQNSPDRPLFAR